MRRVPAFLEGPLEDEGVGRLDLLVIVLLRLYDLEAKLLVKIDGSAVVDLDVPNRVGGNNRRIIIN